MVEKGQHLVFYDGQCGLCDHVVQYLLKVDHHKIFLFAPLQGKTASKYLSNVPQEVKGADSLILIERFQSENPALLLYGKGALRIAWLLGGWWRLLGWVSFLPSCLYDWGYRLIARHRHRFFKKNVCRLPDEEEKNRFLP